MELEKNEISFDKKIVFQKLMLQDTLQLEIKGELILLRFNILEQCDILSRSLR